MVNKKKIEGFRPKEKSAYKVIEVPLRSVLRDRFNFNNNLQHLVIKMNDLIIRGHQFLRLYIIDYYNTERDIPEFPGLPFHYKGHTVPIIDRELITYCFKCLYDRSTNRDDLIKNMNRMNEIKRFYEEQYRPIVEDIDIKFNNNMEKHVLNNINQVLIYQVDKILSNMQTNIQEHFEQHFRKFMNKTIEYNDELKFKKFKDSMFTVNPTVDPEFQEWFDLHRRHIIPWNMQVSVHYDLKVQTFAYLNGLLYMNKILEEKGHKLFQPIPLRSGVIPKNILIDTSILVRHFFPTQDEQGNKVVKKEWLDALINNYENIWNIFFKRNLKIFRSRHYIFNNQIRTDGFSCTLCFVRRDLYGRKYSGQGGTKDLRIEDSDGYFRLIDQFSKEDLDKMKGRPVVGCDPGKKSLVYMTDGKKKLQYTANQRDRESKVTRNKYIMLKEKKKHKIEECESEITKYNSKTVNPEKFKEYIRAKLTVNLQTREFYHNIKWRKFKFRQYAYGQKSLAKFINRIEDTFGKNPIIGYGNWSLHSNNNIRGCKPSMNIGLRREIHKRLDTVSINEDYTSQICSTCSCKLEYYLKDKNGYDIKRLQVCTSPFCQKVRSNKVDKYYRPTTKHLVFKTRDLNSAENILNCTRSYIYFRTRPVQFQRKIDFSSTPVFEMKTFSI